MPSFAISYSGDKFSQPADDFDNAIGDVIHFFFRIEAADSEPDRCVGQILSDAERLQNIRRFQTRRSAGRSGRNRNVVDSHQQRLAFDIGKTHVQIAGQSLLADRR